MIILKTCCLWTEEDRIDLLVYEGQGQSLVSVAAEVFVLPEQLLVHVVLLLQVVCCVGIDLHGQKCRWLLLGYNKSSALGTIIVLSLNF